MTPTECVRLVKFVGARCPAMQMQEDTPDAWYVDLVGYDLADALEAARQASLTATFIGIGDVIRGCQAIVRKRIGEARRAELEAQIEAENAGELHAHPVAALAVGRSVPVDDPVRVERRRMLRTTARQSRVEADTQAKADRDARLAVARAELAALSGPAPAEEAESA